MSETRAVGSCCWLLSTDADMFLRKVMSPGVWDGVGANMLYVRIMTGKGEENANMRI